jgi:hypothetical protein
VSGSEGDSRTLNQRHKQGAVPGLFRFGGAKLWV